MEIAITGVGLVTARIDADPVVMPWAPGRRYRPIVDAPPPGPARLVAAMHDALAACGGDGPIVTASCNGGAASYSADDWRASFALGAGPIASAACASGMHALYLGCRMLEAGAPEVRIVAGDIVTPPCHANFESLRVLSDAPATFQADASGFELGEAAVALRLAPAAQAPHAPRLIGPILGHDLDGDDGIARALAGLGDVQPALVIGQGTGPAESDRIELAALAAHIAADVPLATALARLGHTLGASSLLSVALAVSARDAAPAALAAPDALAAADGRRLGARRSQRTTVVCRALGGACGACFIGEASARPRPRPLAWRPRSAIMPVRDPTLRAIVDAAPRARPARPPDLVIVTLDAPLPPAARIGHRILPTSVLEMTPGQLPQLIARTWGYPGPALCLVGGDPGPLLAACRATHERVYRLAIRGMDDRDVEWDA